MWGAPLSFAPVLSWQLAQAGVAVSGTPRSASASPRLTSAGSTVVGEDVGLGSPA